MNFASRSAGLCVFLALVACTATAESGTQAWLRYAPLDSSIANKYSQMPASVLTLGASPELKSAQKELVTGIRGMLGRTLRISAGTAKESAFILGTLHDLRKIDATFRTDSDVANDAYELVSARVAGQQALVVTSSTPRGVLYGIFSLLRKIAQGESIDSLNEISSPSAPACWVNQWDNLDGSIERGYGGPSIFFENGHVRANLTRAAEFARLLGSIGVNGCVINNVNADVHILDPDFLPQLARIADVFRPYGVQLGVAVNVSMPK